VTSPHWSVPQRRPQVCFTPWGNPQRNVSQGGGGGAGSGVAPQFSSPQNRLFVMTRNFAAASRRTPRKNNRVCGLGRIVSLMDSRSGNTRKMCPLPCNPRRNQIKSAAKQPRAAQPMAPNSLSFPSAANAPSARSQGAAGSGNPLCSTKAMAKRNKPPYEIRSWLIWLMFAFPALASLAG